MQGSVQDLSKYPVTSASRYGEWSDDEDYQPFEFHIVGKEWLDIAEFDVKNLLENMGLIEVLTASSRTILVCADGDTYLSVISPRRKERNELKVLKMWSDENEEELLTLTAQVEQLHSQIVTPISTENNVTDENKCDTSFIITSGNVENTVKEKEQEYSECQINQNKDTDEKEYDMSIKTASGNVENKVQEKEQQFSECQINQNNVTGVKECDTSINTTSGNVENKVQEKEQQFSEGQINQNNDTGEKECDTSINTTSGNVENKVQEKEQQFSEGQINQNNDTGEKECDTSIKTAFGNVENTVQEKEQQFSECQISQNNNTGENECDTSINISSKNVENKEQEKEQQFSECQINQNNTGEKECDTSINISSKNVENKVQEKEQQFSECQINQNNTGEKECDTPIYISPKNVENKVQEKEQQFSECQINQNNTGEKECDTSISTASGNLENKVQEKEQQFSECQINQNNDTGEKECDKSINTTSGNVENKVQEKEQQFSECQINQNNNTGEKECDKSFSSASHNLKVGNKSKERTKRKRVPTRKKLKYISSTDDDIPLSVYAQRNSKESDSDNSDDFDFIPTVKDLNSSDTEFSSDLSDTSKKRRKKDKALEKSWNDTVKQLKSNKKCHTTRKQRIRETNMKNKSARENNFDEVMASSFNDQIIRQALIHANKGRLDQLLKSEGIKRIEVPPYGNCFFESACKSSLIKESPTQLRISLCNHLEEFGAEYMGFIINKYHPENEEEFIAEYLVEIENLKEDGYWSSKVADLLPLSLANYVNCSVTIYTSKPDQQKILIEPTLKKNEEKQMLNLAYTSIPNVLEHYDACVMECVSSDERFVAKRVGTSESSSTQTPKRAAKFVSPRKKKLFRKRKATPENWKKNIRKRLRLSGEEYVSPLGKVVARKTVKHCDCSKCRYKCTSKISDEHRTAIRNFYYGLDSFERQKDYLCTNIQEMKTKTLIDDERELISKKKQVHRKFSFEVNNERVRVCKKFFLKTLDISEAMIVQALSKKNCGHFVGRDERGRHTPSNKTAKEQFQYIKDHIESFPTVEAHYVRKSTKRQFLAPNLNIRKMYEQYVKKCEDNGKEHVNEPVYRRVFNEEYNLSFHVPKKDQCQLCNRYETSKADGTLDDTLRDTYRNHQERKKIAREQKSEDSALAKQDKKVKTCTFDLQSVLYTPCSLVSLMYYMRKLCCYNLSIYSAGGKKASCFIWSETDGKRGSNEISTCLNLFLQSLGPEVEHVILYSDSCAGQNKNQIVATCLSYSVQTVPSLKIIDHKFLESGHTHMECDSMHAAIEFAKSKTRIFVPSQWETVITMARRKSPYHVVTLKHYDFKDFKGSKIKPSTKTQNGQLYKWTDMRWIRFVKNEPEVCFFKYNFNETEEFQRVRMPGARRLCENSVNTLYKSKIPISSAKKKDLLSLCKKGAIPTEFHDYYKGLPSSQSVQDCLPEPDMDETEIDTDTE